jgi:hypothetical protein
MRVGVIYSIVFDPLLNKLWVDGQLQKRPDAKLVKFMREGNLKQAGVQVLPDGFRQIEREAGSQPKGKKKR